jgi:YYY domain-containing protein
VESQIVQIAVIVLWLALYLGLGLFALPAASLLFGDFEDRGAGLAIPLSFAVVALLAYWIGQVRFGIVAAVLAVSGLAGLSVFAYRRGINVDVDRFRDAAIVFLLAYLLLIAIRLFRPGAYPGGGEKFLDFGLLASLLRTTVLPPMDPWFAGESVQYYYGGHLLAAVFATLTDTPARFAYNTALAGYFAAYVTAAWGLAGALAAELDRPYRVGGAFGAFFVGLAGNLSTPARLLVWLLPGESGRAVADLLGLEMVGLANGPLSFNYWYASRVIHADPSGESQLITEFPFFAFLNGDLHGHMMSPAVLLLGAGLAFAYWKRPTADRRGRLLRLLAIAPVGGLLVITNTWSAPAVFGIAALTLLFAPAAPWTLFPRGLSDRIENKVADRPFGVEGGRIGIALSVTIGLALIGALTVLPFLTGAATGRSIGVLPSPRSNLGGLLLVWGAFFGISAAYLAARSDRRRWWGVAVGVAVALVLTAAVQATAIALFAPLLAGGWYLLRTREDVGFETVLLVGSMGLLLLVEFVYVIEQAGPGRMNTLFKIGAQVWALWAVAAGVMAAWLLGPRSPWRSFHGGVRWTWDRLRIPFGTDGAGDESGQRPTRERIAAVLLVVLVLSLSIYPILGFGWAVGSSSDGPTLDAHAFVEEEHPEEADAIRWLRNLSGQPTMVSAPGTEIYRWVNGPSSLTGVPTVAGWAHEIGYRGSEPYWDRVRDVRILYETQEQRSRAALLEKYDVEYVYVGPIERERYDLPNLSTDSNLEPAFENGAVTIYRVELQA